MDIRKLRGVFLRGKDSPSHSPSNRPSPQALLRDGFKDPFFHVHFQGAGGDGEEVRVGKSFLSAAARELDQALARADAQMEVIRGDPQKTYGDQRKGVGIEGVPAGTISKKNLLVLFAERRAAIAELRDFARDAAGQLHGEQTLTLGKAGPRPLSGTEAFGTPSRVEVTTPKNAPPAPKGVVALSKKRSHEPARAAAPRHSPQQRAKQEAEVRRVRAQDRQVIEDHWRSVADFYELQGDEAGAERARANLKPKP